MSAATNLSPLRRVGSPLDGYLTTIQAARYLKVSRKTIQRYASRGLIPYRRVGTSLTHWFARGDLDALCRDVKRGQPGGQHGE